MLAVLTARAARRTRSSRSATSTKAQVRAEAARRGLLVAAKPDSHDICFIADGDTAGFLARRLGDRPGRDRRPERRELLGDHDGAYAFTVGQRRGLRPRSPGDRRTPALRARGLAGRRDRHRRSPRGARDHVARRVAGPVVRPGRRRTAALAGAAPGSRRAASRRPSSDRGGVLHAELDAPRSRRRPGPDARALRRRPRVGSGRPPSRTPSREARRPAGPRASARCPAPTSARPSGSSLGELPDLPHLPELPARGPGADLIGRSAALLVDLPVETAGRLAACRRAGRDRAGRVATCSRGPRRARGGAPGAGPPVKVRSPGRGRWRRASSSPAGTRRSSTPAPPRPRRRRCAEGVADLRRRRADAAARGAQLLLQLDEPSVPAVLAGAVPTASGFGRARRRRGARRRAALRSVVDAAGAVPVVVHCCAAAPPLELFAAAGAAAAVVRPHAARSEAARRSLEEHGRRLPSRPAIGVLAGPGRRPLRRCRTPALPSHPVQAIVARALGLAAESLRERGA